MQEKEVRFRLNEKLFTRFKLICVDKRLSVPKQMSELVRKFVEIQEDNNEKIRGKK